MSAKKAAKKPAAKKPTPKKPAKKAATKPAAKKPAARKPAKKAATKPAAKRPAKKAANKPTPRKPTKKAANKPAKKAEARKPSQRRAAELAAASEVVELPEVAAQQEQLPAAAVLPPEVTPVPGALPAPPAREAPPAVGPVFPRFLERNGPGIRFADIPVADLEALRERLPRSLHDFLTQQGVAAFAGGLLWTVAPGALDDVLAEWLGPGAAHAVPVLRTAFGDLLFWRHGKLCYLDVSYGKVSELAADPALVFELSLTSDRYLDSVINRRTFAAVRKRLPPPLPDQVYAFVPAAALGGSCDPATVEVVKLREHLSILRQLV